MNSSFIFYLIFKDWKTRCTILPWYPGSINLIQKRICWIYTCTLMQSFTLWRIISESLSRLRFLFFFDNWQSITLHAILLHMINLVGFFQRWFNFLIIIRGPRVLMVTWISLHLHWLLFRWCHIYILTSLTLPFLRCTAVSWLKYCRYGVKLYPINHSIQYTCAVLYPLLFSEVRLIKIISIIY